MSKKSKLKILSAVPVELGVEEVSALLNDTLRLLPETLVNYTWNEDGNESNRYKCAVRRIPSDRRYHIEYIFRNAKFRPHVIANIYNRKANVELLFDVYIDVKPLVLEREIFMLQHRLTSLRKTYEATK